MAVKIDEAEQLDEFLQEDVVSFSADFKAMVLKMLSRGQSVEEVAAFACISKQVVYKWAEEWNVKKKLV